MQQITKYFAAIAALVISPAIAIAKPTYTAINLGYGIHANSISNTGLITGVNTSTSLPPAYQKAFIYNKGTISNLGTLYDPSISGYSMGSSINDYGQVTGYANIDNSGTIRAFIYSNGTMTALGAPGINGINGYGINNNGQITGTACASNSSLNCFSFIYDNGTMTDIGNLGTNMTSAVSINNNGQITGGALTATGQVHTFVYANGTMTDIGQNFGYSNGGNDINDLGNIVGGFFVSSNNVNHPYQSHAFFYSNGQATELPYIKGYDNTALRLNNLDQIVGLMTPDDPSQGRAWAYLYSEDTLANINSLMATGFQDTISVAVDINDHGQIIAAGDSGYWYLLNPDQSPIENNTPEPNSLALLLSALTLLNFKRTKAFHSN